MRGPLCGRVRLPYLASMREALCGFVRLPDLASCASIRLLYYSMAPSISSQVLQHLLPRDWVQVAQRVRALQQRVHGRARRRS